MESDLGTPGEKALTAEEGQLPRGAPAARDRLFLLSGRLLLGMLFLLLALRVGMLVARSLRTIPFAFQLDPTEGIVLSECVLLGQRVDIYAPFAPDRFVSAPYPPAYYLATTLLMRLTGLNFGAGRAISFLAVLATAAAIAWTLWRRRQEWAEALLAGLLWLGTAPTLVWAARLKPDLLAVAGSLIGVAWASRFWGQKRLLWAVVPLTVAVWSKQSAMAGVAAILLALLFTDRRLAARFALLLAAVAGIPLLLLDLYSHHGLWQHLVTFHALPWSAGRFLQHLWDVVSAHPVLFAAGLGLLALEVVERKRPGLFSLYFVLTLFFSFSGGTFGGFHNHYLEALAAACLLTGALLQRVRRTEIQLAARLLVLLQVAAFWWTPGWLAYEYSNPTFEQAPRLEVLARFVRDHGGPGQQFFSDNVGLLVTSGQEVRFNDPLVMAQAAAQGLWDERVFVRTIADGQFAAILWRDDLDALPGRSNDLSAAAFAAIRARYAILYRDVEYVYLPVQP